MSDKEAEKEEMKDEAHDVEDKEQEEEEEKREEEEEEQWDSLARTALKKEVTTTDPFAFSVFWVILDLGSIEYWRSRFPGAL